MNSSTDQENRDRIRSADTSARLLVEAGPGTGKTELAAERITKLIELGVVPGQLLVLSFSRSAVSNLTKRIGCLGLSSDLVLEQLRYVSIRTFDSWAFRILRLLGHTPGELLAYSYDKNIATLTALLDGQQQSKVLDMIGKRRHLIIDEFQDLPGVRGDLVLKLLKLLSPPGRSRTGFTILGDPAQAIYGFGAKISGKDTPTLADYWGRVKKMYGSELEVVDLTKNYRADKQLSLLSEKLRIEILGSKTSERKLRIVQKEITTLPNLEESIDSEWLDQPIHNNHAILTRTNGESIRVTQKLFGKRLDGGKVQVFLQAGNYESLPPAWIAAFLSRLLSPELTNSQFSKIFDNLTKQWDEETKKELALPSKSVMWSRLTHASNESDDVRSVNVSKLRSRLKWPDSFPDDQSESEGGLVVTTIHQSKGLEFDAVSVLEPFEPNQSHVKTSSQLEEANVYYVALTRARQKLNLLTRKEVKNPPTKWNFPKDRVRQCSWKNGRMRMEIGIEGDLDPFGFVDPELHQQTDGVMEIQTFLLENAISLSGQKIVLRKHYLKKTKKVVWNVYLQTKNGLGRLIGRTSEQLTKDILHVLHNRGYQLPFTIWNLRVSGVGTVTSDAEFPLEEPYRTSRLWLGVSLFGTGDFKTNKRK